MVVTASIDGFMVFENGKPVGNTFTVFGSAEDAAEAVMSSQSQYGSKVTIEVRAVTLVVGDVVRTELEEANSD